MRTILLSVITILIFENSAYASKILLKNGKIMEGDVVSQDANKIKINFQGIDLTLYKDEISQIDGQGIVNSEILNPKDEQIKEQQTNAQLNKLGTDLADFKQKMDKLKSSFQQEAGAYQPYKSGDINQNLLDAIFLHDLTKVKEFIEQGAGIEHVSSNGWTPLMHAASREDKDIAAFLIEKGANINYKKGDFSAIGVALIQKDTEMAKFLLKSGANPNTRMLAGETALICAVNLGNVDFIKELIEKGADINEASHTRDTALIMAVKNNNSNVVRLLIEKGANISIPNIAGQTALDIAKEKGYEEIANILSKI
jgi:ankyrin repeat protein